VQSGMISIPPVVAGLAINVSLLDLLAGLGHFTAGDPDCIALQYFVSVVCHRLHKFALILEIINNSEHINFDRNRTIVLFL
jgi:hypothetical protein